MKRSPLPPPLALPPKQPLVTSATSATSATLLVTGSAQVASCCPAACTAACPAACTAACPAACTAVCTTAALLTVALWHPLSPLPPRPPPSLLRRPQQLRLLRIRWQGLRWRLPRGLGWQLLPPAFLWHERPAQRRPLRHLRRLPRPVLPLRRTRRPVRQPLPLRDAGCPGRLPRILRPRLRQLRF